MSAALSIAAGERGKLRVFALRPPLSDLADPGAVIDALFAALGVDQLNAADIQIVAIADLEGMSLSAFLHQAYEVPRDQLTRNRALLDGAGGRVALLRSGAFGGRAVTLTLPPDGPARLLAILDEPGPGPVPLKPMTRPETGSMAAPPRPAKSEAAILGRVAMIALLVIFALTFVMILVAR